MSNFEQRIARRPPSKVTIRLQNTNFDDTDFVPAVISEKREFPIVERPLLYRLEVESFSADVKLPVFQPLLDPSVSPQTTIYSFTLAYDQDEVRTVMQFVPQVTDLPSSDPEYYRVYSYSHVVDMINSCLKTSFDSLAETADLPTSRVPYFSMDFDNYRLLLTCDKAGFDDSLDTPIEIYCNTAMERLLASFNYEYNRNAQGGKYAKIIINSTGSNTVNDGYDQVIVEQEQSSARSNWSPLKTIAFISSNLPVRPQLMGSDGSFGEDGAGIATGRDLNVVAEIALNETPGDINTVVYKPDYRKLQDCISGQPLKEVDVSLYYSDGAHYHPLTIPPAGGHIEMTMSFHLRTDL